MAAMTNRFQRARRLIAASTMLVAALTFAPTVAAATVSGTYWIHGYEYFATSTQGRFAGAASGSAGDLATWNAIVDHTPLTTTAGVTGGSASLLTSNVVYIHGDFSGGSVSLVSQSPGCGNQQYAVTGSLGDVTRSDSSAVGSGTFSATLTHYRFSLFGSCIVYSASVSGAIVVNF